MLPDRVDQIERSFDIYSAAQIPIGPAFGGRRGAMNDGFDASRGGGEGCGIAHIADENILRIEPGKRGIISTDERARFVTAFERELDSSRSEKSGGSGDENDHLTSPIDSLIPNPEGIEFE
jgi:hypothetical protein